MSTLQQQSMLKGLEVKNDKGTELVHELFSCIATVHPNKTALCYEDDGGKKHTLSFKEMDNIANQLAQALQKYKRYEMSTSQPLVAVCLKPSHHLPIILLSILKAAMAYLPLDAEFPMSRVKHILKEAQPLMVVVEEGGNLSIYEDTLVMTYEQLLQEGKKIQEIMFETKEISNQLAIVLYTSGSTGIPKGVLIPHSTLLNRLRWQWREFPYSDDEERCVFKTSLTFVDSVPEIWGPLLKGRTLIVVPKSITKDPERFVSCLEKHKIQRLVLVPSLLRSLLMYLGLPDNDNLLARLKLWICSGETLSITLADQFFTTFNDEDKILANFYGSTEVMGDVTYYLLSKHLQLQELEKVPIGKPIDNCIIYLMNKELQLVPQGEIGELVVAGKNLALGYMREQENTKFLDNPYSIDPEYSRIFRTGDYAKLVEETIIYEGRVDSQIKIRGHRVDLTEVERMVSKIPKINKVVILCYKPSELSQALIAFVTLTVNMNLSSMEIQDSLQNIMPPYMLPHVVIVNHIPLLTNGKIDRQALLKQYESSCPHIDNDIVASCNYTDVPNQDLAKARILFPTIISVIGNSTRMPITLHANFYDLGGNSLNSIYTVTKLRDQGYQIGITDFITAKNLAEILNRMKLISFDEEPLKETIDDKLYIFESLNDSHKEDAIQIITESFYSKADLEQWLIPEIKKTDYKELMELMWNSLVEKGLSFAIKKIQNERTIGVTLNFDVWDEPELELNSKLMIVFDFLEYLEKPIREYKLPKGKGKIIHNSMMTTSSNLSSAENVLVMGQMEKYCLQLAKQKGYVGIFTTNTSPLTQQLGTDVYGYETMLVYQVNKYKTTDGSKPFGKAPDSQVAICSLKMIN